jgi:hypothetical protein
VKKTGRQRNMKMPATGEAFSRDKDIKPPEPSLPTGNLVRFGTFVGSVRLTTWSAGWVRPWVLMVGYFRANYAAGVSSLTRFDGSFRARKYGTEIFAHRNLLSAARFNERDDWLGFFFA